MKANQYRYEALKHININQQNKIPIYKGCKNKQCFCTGDCKVIIGYVDKKDIKNP